MGIRVVCPNGHRLNLKSHLAGRHGLCPDCGARFRIPMESTDVPLKAMPRDDASPARQPAVVDLGRPSAESPQEPLQQANVGSAGDIPVRHDDFSPQTVWYVQATEGDKAGERFGPATGDIIQTWIAEGRILPNYLVWRDGWSDWQPGSSILTRQEGRPDGIPTAPITAVGTSVEPFIKATDGRRIVAARSSRSSWKPAIVILLVLTGLVLAIGAGLAMMTGQI